MIFGKSNSFTYQRLFGELHLEGFEVSHTKDGFQWDEHEDIFLELLREELDSGAVPLLRQAEHHRVRAKPEDLTKGAEAAISRAADAIGRDLPPVLAHLTGEPPAPDPPQELPAALSTSRRVIETQLNGAKWQIVLELSADPHLSDWVEMCDHIVADSLFEPPCRRVGVRVALAHPFMTQFAGADPGKMEPLILLAAALGLAEIAAKDGGAVKPGTVRRNVNKLLLSGLPTA